jgi:hypothetical protein
LATGGTVWKNAADSELTPGLPYSIIGYDHEPAFDAEKFFQEFLQERFGPIKSVPNWNDHTATQEQVVALLREAAEIAP